MVKLLKCYNYKCKRKDCTEDINRALCIDRKNKEQAELMKKIDRLKGLEHCPKCKEPMVKAFRNRISIYLCTNCKNMLRVDVYDSCRLSKLC